MQALAPAEAHAAAARTLPQAIIAHARERHALPAILAPGRPALTFGALGERLEAIGATLAGLGLGRAARVAVALPSGADLAVAILGTMRATACAPLDPALDRDAAKALLAQLAIDALMVADDALPVAVAARALGRRVIRLDAEPLAAAGVFRLHSGGAGAPAAATAPGPDDLALLLQTSGTTARPKVVPLTHAQALWGSRRLPLAATDRALCMTPLFAAGPLAASLLSPLVAGASTVITAGFDPQRFCAWLDEFEPTWYSASATIQAASLDALGRGARASSLRFVMATAKALPPRLQQRLEDALGVPVLQGYGMTECGLIALSPLPPGERKPGSVGRPTGIDVSVRDDDGRPLAAGETGEIVVRGPGLMHGYDADPEATGRAFREGWFLTGDLGWRDPDGYLYLTGRRNERINRGGLMVSPAEVDDVLAYHPAVREAVTFAVPHPSLGEDVVAAVVPAEPGAITAKELRDFARARLVPHKVPSSVILVRDLPRNAAGKVERAGLAARLSGALHRPFVAPRDDEERLIAGVVADVLALPRVGALDNFFDLGGDSLRAAQVISRLEAGAGIGLDVAAVFAAPTIEDLAAALRAARAAPDRRGARATLAPRRAPAPTDRS